MLVISNGIQYHGLGTVLERVQNRLRLESDVRWRVPGEVSCYGNDTILRAVLHMRADCYIVFFSNPHACRMCGLLVRSLLAGAQYSFWRNSGDGCGYWPGDGQSAGTHHGSTGWFGRRHPAYSCYG